MNMNEAAEKIKYEDIPPQLQKIVDLIGMENFLTLCCQFGGTQLYFPKVDCITMGIRDREIRRMFDGGNYKELAARYHISERQIRKIINYQR